MTIAIIFKTYELISFRWSSRRLLQWPQCCCLDQLQIEPKRKNKLYFPLAA